MNRHHNSIGLRALCLWLFLWLADARCSPAESGDVAVVVYNASSVESRRVAEHYARQRHVPTNQVVGFRLPLVEEISRLEFKAQLQEPLFDWLVAEKLFTLNHPKDDVTNATPRVVSSPIRYLVLCHGVPLKIRAEPGLIEESASQLRPELRRNEAAVDSELVWLPRLRQDPRITGLLTNTFYGTTNAAVLHPTNGILLVARLDGPNADIACGLVDKALAAERDGLWGRAYVDTRGIKEGNYKLGDDLMRGAAVFCSQMGYDVVVDMSPATFAREFPLSHVVVYAGWYDGNVSGPFALPTVEFMPGAFAYHLHSYSAATLRSTNAHWVGPLLAKGVTASLGSVYEPYLSGTSDVATLLRNWLLLGFGFGEAAWSAEFGFSWQTTVVGDPLYRPWSVSLQTRLRDLEQRNDPRREWALAMQFDQQLGNGRPLASVAYELRKLPLTKTSAVLSEKLGDLFRMQKQAAESLQAYDDALQAKPTPQQTIRLLLACADVQAALGMDMETLRTLQRLLKAAPGYLEQLGFQQRLLTLAMRTGDVALTASCQAQIRRLTGNVSPATNQVQTTPAPPATVTNR